MVKRFSNYQYIEGEPMLERDKQEVGSKFWNKGKWDNFVLPFLPEDCNELGLIDMGCNAGIFLELAENKGFNQVIGIDSNKEAIRRALDYKNRNGGTYSIQRRQIENGIDYLPMSDFTILANVHYYLPINAWFQYLDKLQYKTSYCIVVTAAKSSHQLFKASPDLSDIRKYFKNWDEIGIIDNVSVKNDPFPRNVLSLCFKSRFIDRISTDNLIYDNTLQESFWKEIDNGIDPLLTRYYKDLKKYRNGRWSDDKLSRFIIEKAVLFKDIKENGLKQSIIVDSNNNILDGIHRYNIMKYLGHKSILVRKT